MIRKTIITIAATAVLATSSFASVSYASDEGFEVPPVQTKQRSDRGDRVSGKQIAAGIALGVVAGLLGAEIKIDRGHQGKGFKKQRRAKDCEDVPLLGARKGNKVVAFRQVCN